MMDKYELIFIEDSLSDARYYTSMIEEIGHNNLNLTHVRSLRQFEKLSLRKKFHMIILDISLPRYDGLDTICKVREIEQRSPIIILTGNTDKSLAQSSLKNGANDYLIKGTDDDKICKKMIEFWLKFSEKVYA